MKRHLGDPPALLAFSVSNQRATTFRLIGLILTVFISARLAVATISGAAQTERPRYALPVGDKPGYVNTIEYQLMPNPKEAAALLLKEATLAQTDIDRIGLSPTKPSILVASGPFTPDLSDDSFVRYASEMASRGFAEADTVCLIKIARGVSIREFAEILGLGVQLYRDVPSAFIGRVPFGAAASLLAMPVVEWIGVFEPRHKISPHPYVSGKVLYVYTLVADEQLCRADLAKIGAEVHSFSQGVTDRYATSRFSIRLEPDRLNELAAFWWVQVIGQESEFMNQI